MLLRQKHCFVKYFFDQFELDKVVYDTSYCTAIFFLNLGGLRQLRTPTYCPSSPTKASSKASTNEQCKYHMVVCKYEDLR